MSKNIRILATAAVIAIVATTSACSSTRSSGSDDTTGPALVGIAMPTRSLERWNNDGAHLEELLKKAGLHRPRCSTRTTRSTSRSRQLQNMINQNAKVLVIASIDGTALGPVLKKAADQKIKVIAYDRLIN